MEKKRERMRIGNYGELGRRVLGGERERRGRTARPQGTLPDDRELARSSPAFIVINWIVRMER